MSCCFAHQNESSHNSQVPQSRLRLEGFTNASQSKNGTGSISKCHQSHFTPGLFTNAPVSPQPWRHSQRLEMPTETRVFTDWWYSQRLGYIHKDWDAFMIAPNFTLTLRQLHRLWAFKETGDICEFLQSHTALFANASSLTDTGGIHRDWSICRDQEHLWMLPVSFRLRAFTKTPISPETGGVHREWGHSQTVGIYKSPQCHLRLLDICEDFQFYFLLEPCLCQFCYCI